MGAIPTIDRNKGCWIETPSKAPQIETPLKILVYIYIYIISRERESERERERKRERERERDFEAKTATKILEPPVMETQLVDDARVSPPGKDPVDTGDFGSEIHGKSRI